jgi:copper resistance protein C
MRSRFVIIAILPVLLAAPQGANAHAMLDHANPPVGSTAPSPPRELTLWFTEALEPAFSQAEVLGPSGAIVSTRARVDQAERTQLHVPLKRLGPGDYKVNWHVLSVDTHRTEGSFTFRVGP